MEEELSVTECDSYTWANGNGQTYTQSGDYVWNTTTPEGCDKTVTLHLTINNSVEEELSVTECDSYTWEAGNGQTYTHSGDYVWNTTTPEGCDKTVTLHLTINDSETEEFNETHCDSFVWHGTTYSESGTYTFDTITAAGCERIETLHLTINDSETEEFNETHCDNFVWHGTTYDESGT